MRGSWPGCLSCAITRSMLSRTRLGRVTGRTRRRVDGGTVHRTRRRGGCRLPRCRRTRGLRRRIRRRGTQPRILRRPPRHTRRTRYDGPDPQRDRQRPHTPDATRILHRSSPRAQPHNQDLHFSVDPTGRPALRRATEASTEVFCPSVRNRELRRVRGVTGSAACCRRWRGAARRCAG